MAAAAAAGPSPDEALFTAALHMSAKAAKSAAKAAKVATALKEVLAAVGISASSPAPSSAVGNLLYKVVTELPDSCEGHRPALARALLPGAGGAAPRLGSNAQFTAACKFIKALGPDDSLDTPEVAAAFDKACGVGVVVSDADITAGVKAAIDRLVASGDVSTEDPESGWFQAPSVIKTVKGDVTLRWGNGKAIADEVSKQFIALLGEKPKVRKGGKGGGGGGGGGKSGKGKGGKGTEAPKEGGSGTAAGAAASAEAGAGAGAAAGAGAGAASGSDAAAAASQGFFAARDLATAKNNAALLEEHRRVTGGRLRTRFPPEPNGYLHIGHAKSMNINFSQAFKECGIKPEDGDCFFRYDDTNPAAESHEYIDAQAANVAWLGWKPVQVTYSSDYFDELYAMAVKLIRVGQAYVCHQTRDAMEKSRQLSKAITIHMDEERKAAGREGAAGKAGKAGDGGGGAGDNEDAAFEAALRVSALAKFESPYSPWRDRPVAESLAEFEAMRAGKYAEGAAVLRMKMDPLSTNPVFWDPVAYRIKYVPHPRTGDKWCVYPSYDYTHCIVDSLEHIDLSLCTLEFEVRRDSYYWLLDALDIWRPHVYEFSRLNLEYTMLSKRKILKLVNEGIVRGWDDPRLNTLMGMQRRGYTPEGINALVEDVGITRNKNLIELKRLEFHCRAHLNDTSPRAMAVLDPLRVNLTNVPADFSATFTANNFPTDKEGALGSHTVALCSVLFIERADFVEGADPKNKKFFGLTVGKRVNLKYASAVLECRGVNHTPDGRIESLDAVLLTSADLGDEKRPKGALHWVSSASPDVSPRTAEVRLYTNLFKNKVVGESGDWQSELDGESEVVIPGALVDAGVPADAKTFDRFQFERVGYFVVDKDTAPGYLVLNRTLTLKEAKDAKEAKGATGGGGDKKA